MEDEINLWLKSKRKYYTGLELFDKYVKIRGLSRIFHVGGPTPKNKQTLAYELNKLLRKLNETPKQNTVITPTAESNFPIPEPEKPCPSIALKDQQKGCYKILDHLHPLLSVGEKETRLKAALEILETDDKLKVIDTKLKFFEEHGIVPPDPSAEPEDVVSRNSEADLIKRQMAVRVYISRYKRKVKEGKSLKVIARNQELLAKFQMEMDDITSKLNR
jgi:hypothetical protein